MNDSNHDFHGPAQVISRNDVGAVALCSCGHLHLNLEYLTLRFEPAAFRELVGLLAFAQRRLDTDARLQTDTAPSVDALPMH